MTRNGKIARLPLAIRLELNHRLQDGQKGRLLVAWLNRLPEVQAVLAAEFKGEPVTDCNLTRWKNGGYRTWVEEQNAREAVMAMVEHFPALREATKDGLSDKMALLLKVKMVVQMQRLDSMREDASKSALWNELLKQFAVMRRGELQSERLQLQRDKLGLEDARRPDSSGLAGVNPTLTPTR